MTSVEPKTERKTGVVEKKAATRPCPHCREAVPITSESCIFCAKPTNFLQAESARRQKTRESIAAYRKRQEQEARSGGLTTGVAVAAFSALVFALSVAGALLAPEEIPFGTAVFGAFMGLVGVGFGVHCLLNALRSR
jgi:hypothetical protein